MGISLTNQRRWVKNSMQSWINLNRQSKTALNILHGCVIPLTQFHDWYHWPVCLNMEVIYSNRIPNALWRNHLPKLKRHKQQMKKKCKIGHLGETKLSSLWSQSRQPGTTFNWEWKLKIHTCASTQSFPKSRVNDIHTAHTVQIFLCSPRKLRPSNIKITMRSELELIIYGWIRTNIQKMRKQRVVNQSEDNIFFMQFSREEMIPTGELQFNPLHPNVIMQILHTVLYTFPELLTRRISLIIQTFCSCWSFPSFSWP